MTKNILLIEWIFNLIIVRYILTARTQSFVYENNIPYLPLSFTSLSNVCERPYIFIILLLDLVKLKLFN